eukprot:CAMPEP_0203927796 /NCGR_PEP_ID=MMETSP0359-20131031/67177_1 /ASSEMBLY_ACC=CAM_ASM_000338 /TAXON_ID=268821 /ORGANISM="Scrippsiella Hangoei, Strain SHTV-5" /LENGTH=97 /DNA_ID=CAMNT_0050856629 /DNA_START=9 /DNA_END=299 /DNA_ORIENTATION=+
MASAAEVAPPDGADGCGGPSQGVEFVVREVFAMFVRPASSSGELQRMDEGSREGDDAYYVPSTFAPRLLHGGGGGRQRAAAEKEGLPLKVFSETYRC